MNSSRENLLDSEEYLTILSPEKYKKQGNRQKWPQLRDFLFDTKTGSFLGRPKSEWSLVVAFYGVFYLSLLVYFGILIGILTAILDEIHPWRQGMDSPLKFTPGLAFRPMPFFQTKLVRFIQGKPSTYKPYTDHIQAFLLEYENEKQVGENFIDCEKGKPPDQLQKVCRFNVDQLGGLCTWQRDYGYDEGKPCVILKLNKYPADHENIGNISYWPAEGWPGYFFPYLNQEGFRSPLVMIRFDNPINGVLIQVACYAWAKNIRQHLNDQLGVVTFELMVD
ncbi:hypothetical protein LSH36_532g04037 [Paralvinella palmiformis]|uniref:Sodium/potassium-transporting ATPase subunit beta-1 n=1 Tax=Paralvinella palmiformis TaxID=53620 RepID=A0AAD9MXI6_9ANNE|nr:hypothetical protein LSH36_532g04037 [Paralvinella palmiformis]